MGDHPWPAPEQDDPPASPHLDQQVLPLVDGVHLDLRRDAAGQRPLRLLHRRAQLADGLRVLRHVEVGRLLGGGGTGGKTTALWPPSQR